MISPPIMHYDKSPRVVLQLTVLEGLGIRMIFWRNLVKSRFVSKD